MGIQRIDAVFVDASGYIAASHTRDTHHDRVSAFLADFEGQLVTTEFVLEETGNYLSKARHRPFFHRLMDEVVADPKTVIVEATHHLWQRGYQLFADRADKEWSMTDCISFVVMKERNLRYALATDHHFLQAGFAIPL